MIVGQRLVFVVVEDDDVDIQNGRPPRPSPGERPWPFSEALGAEREQRSVRLLLRRLLLGGGGDGDRRRVSGSASACGARRTWAWRPHRPARGIPAVGRGPWPRHPLDLAQTVHFVVFSVLVFLSVVEVWLTRPVALSPRPALVRRRCWGAPGSGQARARPFSPASGPPDHGTAILPHRPRFVCRLRLHVVQRVKEGTASLPGVTRRRRRHAADSWWSGVARHHRRRVPYLPGRMKAFKGLSLVVGLGSRWARGIVAGDQRSRRHLLPCASREGTRRIDDTEGIV